ncbi:MAG TPA: metallophosphoesterase family protein [Solirubrobacteraceae bacterium]|nr:metallophosphoesterase family protein [Solirubrobacteraceae bacterium]
MNIAVIADTHMPRGRRRLPGACVERLRGLDLIVHAGDFTALEVLDQFNAYGPLIAVRGNVDEPAIRAVLPETVEVDVAGRRIAVIHDAGPANGRLGRLRRRFPAADAVVFGHSHLPLHERAEDGFQIFNPGSPTERRRAPWPSMGVALIESGQLSFELIPLG